MTSWLAGNWRALALTGVMLALVGACLLFTAHSIRANNRNFCDVIHGVTATVVQRPADVAANPSREQAWEWYIRFVRLGQSLGCGP